MELRLGRSILQNPHSDLFRGVQSVLVDKTGRAQWNPSRITDVTEEMVARHFKPLTDLGMEDFNPN